MMPIDPPDKSKTGGDVSMPARGQSTGGTAMPGNAPHEETAQGVPMPGRTQATAGESADTNAQAGGVQMPGPVERGAPTGVPMPGQASGPPT
jgi:hypothetical protein